MYTHHTKNRGVTLFISLVTVSIVLAIGLSILNITLKDFLLSGIVKDSEKAFAAADMGMECASYWDEHVDGSYFNKAGSQTITCAGQSTSFTDPITVGSKADIRINRNAEGMCANVEVYKYDTGTSVGRKKVCPSGLICTEIISRGYNRPDCSALSNPRTVERAIQANY